MNGVGLEYRAGDHISVVGRRSEEMFEGALNGRTGTFSANDVVFHKGKEKEEEEDERWWRGGWRMRGEG